ncbi:BEL1-like homeodomain protein 1 [Ricinus communis]|uniref:BEL1-like homeodomain protein 1 n=1 Tax=Ricinus communis TaxID=3988 RepID=UPI00201A5C23|nr:BEL1-like homeodomain protein 1 [Ricinus communis]XP_048235832.1 BEL1-like homeodomain protein 1 [Ricinus communis]XP_048235833.1 BEL1-like homeodomain protein 1 [Ricinus communis]
MATYFHGNPEIQAAAAEGLQTLVLMNPTYVQYSDTPPPQPSSNLVFLNSAASNLTPPPHFSHAPPSTQQFVGIPLDPNSHDTSTLHGLVPRIHYNLYNPIDPASAAREIPRAQQGLSLSLSSQQQPGYGSQAQAVSGEDMRVSGGSVSSGSGVTNGVSGIQGVLLSSKYLKAAQELLDEVVNVNNNGLKSELSKKGNNGIISNNSNKALGESSAGEGSAGGGGDSGAGGKRGAELSTAERQEIQMKKAKLISMLDEVEQRYRQYHHQMQIVISSFEQAAGIGSAKTYTALALQTISKQFRCLKDAITGQIKAANKSLGEEDCLGGKLEGSRLKFVDHHLRQQRALQQLGMIQHNAWRPQRGLPERSVSVLRAWLFEHFLHPYPKDSDKHMLAKQTGLTRSQVSNWFINARVRLWKPMVEEMYLEEIKEQERNGSDDKTSKSEQNENAAPKSVLQEKGSAVENQTKSFKSLDGSPNHNAPSAVSVSTASTSPIGGNVRNQSGFSLIGSSELEGITQGSPKRHRSTEMIQSPTSVPSINMDIKPGEMNNDQISMKFGSERQNRDGYSFIGGQTNFIGGFGQYPIGDLGRFDTEQFTPRFSGNGVSLTLGLPHCENLSMSGTHESFLPSQNIQLGRRVEISEPNEFGGINTSTPHSSTAYESINIQNRKRFAAQLLPDFVA